MISSSEIHQVRLISFLCLHLGRIHYLQVSQGANALAPELSWIMSNDMAPVQPSLIVQFLNLPLSAFSYLV